MPPLWKLPLICSRSPIERLNEELNGFLKESKDVREQCKRKDEECKAAITKQLQEAEERFKKEISGKEEECKALVSDKRFLESLVLQSNAETQVICAELEAVYKNCKLEKDELSSQIVAARKETEEITKSSQMAEEAWNTDKEKLLSSLAAYEKKIEEMAMEKERVLVQSKAEKIELESRLNKSEARTHELLEEKHLWVSEKETLDNNVVELQRKLDFMASEKELLCQKNRELSTEVESLETQLNENNARLAHLEDEREKSERVLHQSRAEKIDLQFELNECKERVQDLVRKNEQDMHLWNEEKRYLEFNLAELQTNFGLMASERKSMIKKIIELCREVEFLKTLENEYNAAPVYLEEGRLLLKAESPNDEKLLRYLLTKVATIETDINNFQQHVKEGEKQRLNLIEQYKETENSLHQHNEIQREMDDMRLLLQTQNQRVEELNTVLHSLSKILESRNSQPLLVRLVVLENGKPDNVHESTCGESNVVTENRKPNHLHECRNGKPDNVHESTCGESNGVTEKRKPDHLHECRNRKLNSLHEKTKLKPNCAIERKTPNRKLVNQTISALEMPKSQRSVDQRYTLSKSVPVKQTPKRVSRKQSPNVVSQKPYWRF